MAASFTSRPSASVYIYFMKALHHRLPVAVQKRLYNRHYLSVLCLYCGEVEVSDHMFSYKIDESTRRQLLDSHGFVFNSWFREAVCIFCNSKIAVLEIVKFVHSLGLAFREDVWSVHAKHCAYIEKNGLIPLDGSAIISVHGLASRFSAGVVRLLGIIDALDVHFGFHKLCLFFSGLGNLVSVHIAV
ncbi:hypothetical protein G9A89_013442 [Geosiphon pyriformis]|nr:hypothetical protein G9A89_013442 [Geosiphon pyriformis]